ncbi:hypothetical protein [Actinoalloteichus hymeniacidonis]|uniref:hypothetical protein n=1 Tax=Actinoalloteichus hymeniacidonis TaxID=340345 RepID=UPI0012F7DC2D|nr:hypothetical protein [Actinoalloteichus hymeniacidonis]MBB5909181.1 hypothetical protein [Actinoalloteichus hymeniacidonis]
MERRIDLDNLDLDQAALLVDQRRRRWSAAGITVARITWMDAHDGWPRPLYENRRLVRRPMSLGLELDGTGGSAWIVLYAGGWADVDLMVGDADPVAEYVEPATVAEFGPLLDRVSDRL